MMPSEAGNAQDVPSLVAFPEWTPGRRPVDLQGWRSSFEAFARALKGGHEACNMAGEYGAPRGPIDPKNP